MFNLIAGFALVGSLTGMGVIALSNVERVRGVEPSSFSLILFIKKTFEKISSRLSTVWEKIFSSFSWDLFLQRILSKIRVLSLRMERISAKWLKTLRERSKEKKEREDYWSRLTRFSKRKKSSDEDVPA